jgi:hypothetical protein
VPKGAARKDKEELKIRLKDDYAESKSEFQGLNKDKQRRDSTQNSKMKLSSYVSDLFIKRIEQEGSEQSKIIFKEIM